mgnify:CR=1 FL=1
MSSTKKYIDYKKAYLILYEIKTVKRLKFTSGLSFNIILEGLFRNSVLRVENDIEGVEYRSKKIYITRLPIKENKNWFYLPSLTPDNNTYEFIECIPTDDQIYTYYCLNDSGLKEIGKRYDAEVKDKPVYIAFASFYCNLTQSGFSVQENQFLKAILLKVLFNSSTSPTLEPEVTELKRKVSQLLLDTFSKQNDNTLAEININIENNNLIDAYFIHNAFVRAYNLLNISSKRIIKGLFNASISQIKANEFYS